MIGLRNVTPLILGLVALFANGSHAAELYSVQYAGRSPLYHVNQSNGSVNPVNAAALADIGDLTSDTRPGQHTVWGVILPTVDTELDNNLITIDSFSGQIITSVAISGLVGENSKITSLAFDPVSGVLYGNTTVSYGDTADRLYRIDTATGAATLVGDILTPAGAPFSDIFALAFDQTGKLFGITNVDNQLVQIDPSDGSGSFIATLPLAKSFDIASRPEDNVMFLTNTASGALYTLDTLTGQLSFVGSHSQNLVGLAFAVPEPQTWALVLAGTAMLGWIVRRNITGSAKHA
jgi:hypothetical protein